MQQYGEKLRICEWAKKDSIVTIISNFAVLFEITYHHPPRTKGKCDVQRLGVPNSLLYNEYVLWSSAPCNREHF